MSDGIEASCGAALDAAAPGFTRVVSSPGASEPDYSSIEVLYFSGDVFPERSREFAVAALKSENLRWMHTFSAGVDDAFFRTLIERGVRLTTSSGAQAEPRGDEPWETLSMAELPGLLPELDALVVAVPLTEATRNLMDEAAFARLKPGALFVNVARGEVVDEDALIDSLRSGRLGGAGLDVFRQEPLPEESPLWAMPNVLITPHSSGTSPGNEVRASRIFIENLRAYLGGEPLRNEVGPEGVR